VQKDIDLLLKKMQASQQNYGAQIVVGNLLSTRFDQVTLRRIIDDNATLQCITRHNLDHALTAHGEQLLPSVFVDDGVAIENALVKQLISTHDTLLSSSSSSS
jgi:hypothetical protein